MIGVGVPVENQSPGHRECHDRDGCRRIEIIGGTVLVWSLAVRQLTGLQLTVLRHSLAAYALGLPVAAP